MLRRYEERSDRRFSDEVLDTGIEYDEAGAYLLGRDLRALCVSGDEQDAIVRFLERVNQRDFQVPAGLVPPMDEDSEPPWVHHVAALARGFGSAP